MKVYFGSKDLRLSPSAVALGGFDAIHKGHAAIISDMISYAKENKLLSVVYMFASPFDKGQKMLNTLQKRLEILEAEGVECCVVEEFDEEFKNTSKETFAKEYISNRLGAKAIFVGFDYRFGKGAEGSAADLKTLCRAEVFVKDCVKLCGRAVSSTAIKEMIEAGDVKAASEYMGRHFSLSGKVVRGKQIGRTIGFPTANLKYPEGIVIPKMGVYITKSKIGGKKYYSITNVGEKPTISDKTQNIETSIGEFSDDIYGEVIEVEFCERIREIRKFSSLDALKSQLKSDMLAAKKYFKGE